MHLTKRVLILAVLAAFLLPTPSILYAGNYSSGPVVACYIKNRKKPKWPGWTMLWKDSVKRSKGCKQVLAACKNMTKKWGGTDYCCTLQHGNKKIVGKNAKTRACIAAKPKPKGANERKDNRCGPKYGNAKCGTNRCCSKAGWCGGKKQPHCGAQRGFKGKFDGKRK